MHLQFTAILKTILIGGLITLGCYSATYAQSYNYQEYSFGFSGSFTKAYVDVKEQKTRRALSVNYNYNYSPFLTVGAELQFGKLAGGDHVKNQHLREFANSYTALILNADIQAGEIIDYDNNWFLDGIKNIYVGTGLGLIHNKMTFIQRIKPDGSNYVFPGKDKSINFIIPLKAGYEFKIYNGYGEPQYRLGIGYQLNLTFGEGLDGYNDPPSKFRNDALDMYSQVTVGIKIGIGNITSYKKPIRW